MNKWFDIAGEENDVAVSTRVRFARNLKNIPFPSRMDDKTAADVMDKVGMALAGGAVNFQRLDFDKMEASARGALAERHVVSRDLVNGKLPRGVYVSPDESCAVMVNEEDHLRIQSVGSGLCIRKCLDEAGRLDDLLDESLGFAFSEDYGYLTACATNIGCGLRASVMLHLPALTESGGIREIINASAKVGLTLRGAFGEGTQAAGALYQVSNALSLGLTEDEICRRLESAVRKIIDAERSVRKKLAKDNLPYLENRVYRAKGILTGARIISSEEALRLISDLRLGAGVLDGIDTVKTDRLLWEIGVNNIISRDKAYTAPDKRDIARAEIIRNTL